jgi:hypothetical protein
MRLHSYGASLHTSEKDNACALENRTYKNHNVCCAEYGMLWNRSSAGLVAAWQAMVDEQLEAGQTPLLDLGAPPQPLSGLPALTALCAFAASRMDITAPVVTTGGDGSLWVATLFYALDERRGPRPRPLRLLYAGADAATISATAATQSEPLAHPALRTTENSLIGWQRQMAPARQPAAALISEALPFLLTDPNIDPITDGFIAQPAIEPTVESWLANVGLALSLGLILIAILIALFV